MELVSLPKVLGLIIFLNWGCNGKELEAPFLAEVNYEASSKGVDFTLSSSAESRSAGTCKSTGGCNRFKASVYNLISTAKPSGSPRRVVLTPKRTYFNYKITELVQTIKVNKAITETATLELSSAFHRVESIDFEDNVLALFQNSESIALQKLKTELPTAFQIESSSKQPRRYGVAAKKLYKFDRTVTVSYCEEYEISSVLEVIDNAKTNYLAHIKITGEDLAGKKLSEQEILKGLDGAGFTFLKGDSKGNHVTAIATAEINLIETYVDKNITNGKGTPIADCLTAFTIYKANVFSLDKTSSNDGTKKEMVITYKSTFCNDYFNDENHNASFGYSQVSDTAEFQFSSGLKSMSSISFENGVIAMLKGSLPNPPKTKATDKLVKELPTAFQSGSKPHVVVDKTKHELQTIAVVPSDHRDERWYATKMVENMETNYDIKVKITSELKVVGKKFSADEIRDGLKEENGLKFLDNADAFTAVVETTAKLVESYIDSVFVKQNTTKIKGFCL